MRDVAYKWFFIDERSQPPEADRNDPGFQQIMAELLKVRDELSQANQNARNYKDSIEKRFQEQRDENKSLDERLEKQETKLQKLRHDHRKLCLEYDELVQEYETSKQENKALQGQLATMKTRIESLGKSKADLEAEMSARVAKDLHNHRRKPSHSNYPPNAYNSTKALRKTSNTPPHSTTQGTSPMPRSASRSSYATSAASSSTIINSDMVEQSSDDQRSSSRRRHRSSRSSSQDSTTRKEHLRSREYNHRSKSDRSSRDVDVTLYDQGIKTTKKTYIVVAGS